MGLSQRAAPGTTGQSGESHRTHCATRPASHRIHPICQGWLPNLHRRGPSGARSRACRTPARYCLPPAPSSADISFVLRSLCRADLSRDREGRLGRNDGVLRRRFGLRQSGSGRHGSGFRTARDQRWGRAAAAGVAEQSVVPGIDRHSRVRCATDPTRSGIPRAPHPRTPTLELFQPDRCCECRLPSEHLAPALRRGPTHWAAVSRSAAGVYSAEKRLQR